MPRAPAGIGRSSTLEWSSSAATRFARRALGPAAIGLAVLVAPARAHAESAAAAEAFFKQGRVAMDAKDYDTACQRFRESRRLDPAVGTTLNLAACEEARGRLATSWELFQAAYDKLDSSDSRRVYAKVHADQLEPRLPKVVLMLAPGAPSGTHVRDDDSDYTSASFGAPIPMDPGKHSLVVQAPGYDARTVEITVAGSSQQTVQVAPGPKSVAPPGAPAGAGSGPAPHHDTRTLGFVLGGAGVAGLGVGAVAGVLALSQKHIAQQNCDYTRQVCTTKGGDAVSTGHTLAWVSTAGWIAGALGVAAGAYFVVTSGSSKEQTAVTASGGPDGAMLSVNHVW